MFVLGRGATLPVAMEAALKFEETCAIHAEAFSSAEVRHGPADLVGQSFPVLAFLPDDNARAGLETTLAELAKTGADILRVVCGAADGETTLGVAACGSGWLEPIAMIHRFYGLAEATARTLGRDPDRPRNLRKVTETV
ncbi:MAG: SIS domain-containing protein [Roseiarcus sp.]